jgi:hypothetical protein
MKRFVTLSLILISFVLTACFPGLQNNEPQPTHLWKGNLKVTFASIPIPLNFGLDCPSFDSETVISASCTVTALGTEVDEPSPLNGLRNGDFIDLTLASPNDPTDVVLFQGELDGNTFSAHTTAKGSFGETEFDVDYNLELTVEKLNSAGVPEDLTYDASGYWDVSILITDGQSTATIIGNCNINDDAGALSGDCNLAVGGTQGYMKLSGRRTGISAKFFISNALNELVGINNRRIYITGSFSQAEFTGQADVYTEAQLRGSVRMSQ